MMVGIQLEDETENNKWKAGVRERLARVNKEVLQPHRRAAKLMRSAKKPPMILFMSGT